MRKTIPSKGHINFYPRSPCGERLVTVGLLMCNLYFYPRSPCGERRAYQRHFPPDENFYPRSPCGERPLCVFLICLLLDFYPRSPCGERLAKELALAAKNAVFLSTLSLRRATRGRFLPKWGHRISIHALLAESDSGIIWGDFVGRRFLSTLSLRRATLRRQ